MALYHSSGSFTIDLAKQVQANLEEELPLLLIRRAVAAGETGLDLRLDRGWLQQERRRVSNAQVQREIKLIEERARFCPIPLRLNGYIVQPENLRIQPDRSDSLLNRGYHLAERYSAGRGLALFCPDAHHPGPRVNSPYTYWRDRPSGLTQLRWWMPWRVAGQVARLKSCPGLRCGSAALLLAQTGQAGRAIAVHQGLVVGEFPLEIPGLTFIFDASKFAVDASHLKIVHSLELRAYLHEQCQFLSQWVGERLPRWQSARVTHRQNKKEMAAWLSVWGASLVSGLAVFLPLPLLGLPWIIWHHAARRRILQRWRARLDELQTSTTSRPTP